MRNREQELAATLENKNDRTERLKQEIYRVLPGKLREYIMRLPIRFSGLQEIRLRIEEPVLVRYEGQEYFLSSRGCLGKDPGQAYRLGRGEMRETLEYISNYSMYAYEEELKQGYITIRGGHRIGIAGKGILEGNKIKSISHISFLNIRLAHEIIGCAAPVLPHIWERERIYHTLIVSPPRQGKTTLLRDLIRMISNGTGNTSGITVGVVDERSELGSCYRGIPQNDLGYRTDILDGCPKAEGMMLLVRSMAPEVVAVDEIGSADDVEAMEYVMNCGVKILATVHGNGMEDIKAKPVLGRLVQEKVFQRYVVLGGRKIGQIEAIYDEKGSLLLTGNEIEKEQAAC